MGGRYIITDTQLSLLTMHADAENHNQCEKIINEVAEIQWIGQSQNKAEDDIETLKEFYSLITKKLSFVCLMTGVEIGLIISDLKHDNFTKIMIDIHNIKENKKLGNTDQPIADHVIDLMNFFVAQDNVLGEEIFAGKESNEER